MHTLFSKPPSLRSPVGKTHLRDLALPSSGPRRAALASAGLAREGPFASRAPRVAWRREAACPGLSGERPSVTSFPPAAAGGVMWFRCRPLSPRGGLRAFKQRF